MPTTDSVFSNYARLEIEGQVDIAADGEVSAVRGDGLTCTYDGSGGADYVLTYKAGGGMKLVSVLSALVTVMDTTASATTAASVTAVAQTSNTDDITVTFATQNAAGGAATEEGTAVATLNVRVVVQTARMSNPLS